MRLTEKQLQEIKQKITHIDDWLEYSTGYTLHKNLIDTIEALQQENEQLRALVAELRDNLKWLKSISFSHEDDLELWPSQETRESIEHALSESAGMDYHNPADVEALRKAREAIQKAYDNYELIGEYEYDISSYLEEALAAIDKAIGGGDVDKG